MDRGPLELALAPLEPTGTTLLYARLDPNPNPNLNPNPDPDPNPNQELYFAGEHTSEEHPATVVGAYLSGLTAARTVAKDWPQANSTPVGRPTPVGTK